MCDRNQAVRLAKAYRGLSRFLYEISVQDARKGSVSTLANPNKSITSILYSLAKIISKKYNQKNP